MGLHDAVNVALERYTTTRQLEDDVDVDEHVLGSGMSGSVRLGARVGSGVKCAIKSFSKRDLSEHSQTDLSNEIEVYMHVDHPHIARLENVYENDTHVHIVMECLEGGEVFTRVLEGGRFSEKQAAKIMRQMLLAVSYLHRHNIIHRDLKLENFVFEKKGGNHVKLIDFGLAKHWDGRTSMRQQCGTVMYMAPEVLRRSYTTKADMWSLGVTAYILLTGAPPFPNDEAEAVRMIKAGRPHLSPSRFSPLSAAAKDFVRRLMHASQTERMSAEEALAHPWIQAHQQQLTPDEQLIQNLREFTVLSPLRQACLSVAAWSASTDEQARVREQFLALDQDNNGVVSVDELKKALVPRGVPEPEVQKLFTCLDRNRDGEVAFSEFLSACVFSLDNDALCSIFKRFDVDSNGSIGLTDLSQVLLDDSDGSSRAHEMLREIESTEDGAISFDEFCAFLKSPREEQNPSIGGASTDTGVCSGCEEHSDGDTAVTHFDGAEPPLKQVNVFTEKWNVFSRKSPKPNKTNHRRVLQCFFGHARPS
jgi:calcium-dependent protein kinase